MLGDMNRGITVPLVWCVDTSVCLCYLFIYFLYDMLLDFWLHFYGSCCGNRHNPFIGYWQPSIIIGKCVLTMTLCLSNVTMNSSPQKISIEMILEWRVGNIFAYFACIENLWNEIWAWWVDAIVDKLGSFTLNRVFEGSLVLPIVVNAFR